MVISFNIGNFSQPKISKIIIHATKKKTYQTLKKMSDIISNKSKTLRL